MHGGFEGLDIGTGVAGRDVSGVIRAQQRGPGGDFAQRFGVALHGKAAGREAAAVAFDGGHVSLFIHLGQAGVLVAAAGTVLFVHEQHSAHGALGLEAGGAEQAQGLHALRDAGAVVVGPLGEVPRVEVAADGDDFLWEF